MQVYALYTGFTPVLKVYTILFYACFTPVLKVYTLLFYAHFTPVLQVYTLGVGPLLSFLRHVHDGVRVGQVIGDDLVSE